MWARWRLVSTTTAAAGRCKETSRLLNGCLACRPRHWQPNAAVVSRSLARLLAADRSALSGKFASSLVAQLGARNSRHEARGSRLETQSSMNGDANGADRGASACFIARRRAVPWTRAGGLAGGRRARPPGGQFVPRPCISRARLRAASRR